MHALCPSVITVVLLAGSVGGVAAQSGQDPTSRPPIPSAGCGSSQVEPGTYRTEELSVGDAQMKWAMHVPEAHDGTSPLPLWVQLHEVGGSGSAQVGMLAHDADTHGFVVVGPDADLGDAGWTWREDDPELDLSTSNPDIAFIDALIDHLGAELCLDLARVYVAGWSGGGEGASVLGCVLEDVVAAVAPAAGMLDPGAACELDRPVPLLAIHGTADDSNYFEGGLRPGYDEFPVVQALAQTSIPERVTNAALRNGCGAEPSIEVLTDAVESWAEAVERWTWDCPRGADVGLLVHGGGHAWPQSGDVGFDATELVWEFFEQHPMPE